jgi:flagellar hook assembly protein FlgD
VPDPSHGNTRIQLELSRATTLEVVIYDASGRRVRRLLHGSSEAGRHALVWDGSDDRGRATKPGVFFVRASAAGALATRRLTRAR